MENNSMDHLFEELLKESASLAAKELGEEAQSNGGMEFSKEHQDRMEKLFNSNKPRRKKLRVFVPRLLVAIFSVIIVSTAIFKADAIKIRFLNIFTNTKPTNTEISFLDGTSYSNDNITLEYVPEGFELKNENVMKNMTYLKFRRNEEYFIVEVRDSYGAGSVDTENAKSEMIEVNGVEILYTEKKDANLFSYYIDEHLINVSGNAEKDLLLKIIKNIKLN